MKSLTENSTIVKYSLEPFRKVLPTEQFIREQIGKADGKFSLSRKTSWRVGFLLRTGQVQRNANGTFQVKDHTCNLKKWQCTCGQPKACEHRIAAAILFRWQRLGDTYPVAGVFETLLNQVRSRRGVELSLQVEVFMAHQFGIKPTLKLLGYTLDGETVTIPAHYNLTICYHEFNDLLQTTGVVLESKTDTEGDPFALHWATYHLFYKGFFDHQVGGYVDKRTPLQPSPINHLQQNQDFWRTPRNLQKTRGNFPEIPMTGAS